MPFAAKRPVCDRCQRPQSTCICQWIAPVEHAVEVLILQHPLEVKQAKGSARLLHLCLPHSRIVVGEKFDDDALHALLFDDWISVFGKTDRQPVLLYPDTPGDVAGGISPPPALAQSVLDNPAQLRLVVLDGTWRKSHKQLYLNPLLQQLPRLPLRDAPQSHYLIRKAHKPDQLSTFEATCFALAQLEGDDDRFRLMMNAFDGFVSQQMEYGSMTCRVR